MSVRYPPKRLTPRMKETLLYLAKGMSTPEIALVMGVVPSTAKTHKDKLLMYYGVNRILEVVVSALKVGDLKLEDI